MSSFDDVIEMARVIYSERRLDEQDLKAEREIFRSVFRNAQELGNAFNHFIENNSMGKAQKKLAELSYNYLKLSRDFR